MPFYWTVHFFYPTSPIKVKFITPINSDYAIISIQIYVIGYHYDLRLKSRASYILVGIWCLMTVVLANGYAGTLFSFLSVAKLEPAINSLEELANANKNLQLIIQDKKKLTDRLMVREI